jgi:SAM-dependent methyltransferase
VSDDRDYVLGTHDEELERLGLQHRVWRPHVLECWAKAGVTVAKKVIDVGAGPGFAARDLAEIVGPSGAVAAVERSRKFVSALRQTAQARRLANTQIYERDLMTDELPGEQYDFSWCRWVAAFVSEPALLLKKISKALRPGGVAIFHEYGHYETWRYYPAQPHHERFRQHVIDTWRESGGEPDAAPIIIGLLRESGFTIRWVKPLIFCIRPSDYMWQWPAGFIDVYLPRLRETGAIDAAFEDAVRDEMKQVESRKDVVMITPLVLEIVAEKVS